MEQQNRILPASDENASRIKLSIVAPCYNEEGAIEEFHRRMSAAAKDVVGDNYELILLNDGSSDRTWSMMRDHVRPPHVSRRCGPDDRLRLAGPAGTAWRDVAHDGAQLFRRGLRRPPQSGG